LFYLSNQTKDEKQQTYYNLPLYVSSLAQLDLDLAMLGVWRNQTLRVVATRGASGSKQTITINNCCADGGITPYVSLYVVKRSPRVGGKS
jgi:hypothetical protein